MAVDASTLLLEELLMAGCVGTASYCLVELLRVLGPPTRASEPLPPRSSRARPYVIPVVLAVALADAVVVGATLGSAATIRIDAAVAAVLGTASALALTGLGEASADALARGLARSGPELGALPGVRAAQRSATSALVGTLAIVYGTLLVGFLSLSGAIPTLAISGAVLASAAVATAIASPRDEDGPRGTRTTPTLLRWGAALLLVALVPMVLAAADPLVLSLVPYAELLGPTLSLVAVLPLGVAAGITRFRPERTRGTPYSGVLLLAAAAAIAGVAAVTGFLTHYAIPYLLLGGLGIAIGVALGWSSRDDHGPRVDASIGLRLVPYGAAGAIGVGAIYLGGWGAWPFATVWNGALALFGVALALLLAVAMVGPPTVVALSDELLPGTVDLWASDPRSVEPMVGLERLRGLGAAGRDASRRAGPATAWLAVASLASAAVPLGAADAGTDTLTWLHSGELVQAPLLLGLVIGLVTAAVALTFLTPSAPFDRPRRGALRTVMIAPLLGMVAGVAGGLGPGAAVGLLLGDLVGAVAVGAMVVGAVPDGASVSPPPDRSVLLLLLGLVPFLILAGAFVGLPLLPVTHWSPGP